MSEMFQFVGRVKPEEIPVYLAQVDVAFLSFQDSPLFEKTIPAKLQSYMACGMPILAVANGETERIIMEADCSICSGIGDAEGMSEKIREIIEMDFGEMGKKGREYFEIHFEKQMLMKQIETYFK